MKATRQGIRSTKKNNNNDNTETIDEDEPLEPPRPHLERAVNHQVVCAVIATKDLNGTISTDLPGRFPFTSNLSNNYIFLLYDCDSNNILIRPIKSREKSELVRGFEMCYKDLKEANITPILHRLDNEISDDLIAAIKDKKMKYQICTPYQGSISTYVLVLGLVFVQNS